MLALLAIAFAAAGCGTTADPHWVFGTWRVERYTVDSYPQNSYLLQNTTCSFQNGIVQVVGLTDSYGNANICWGTWAVDEPASTFTLNFTHSDAQRPAGTDFYQGPAWLGMNVSVPIVMHYELDELEGHRLHWQWTAPDGTRQEYTLARVWN